jgi:hypothetical protein
MSDLPALTDLCSLYLREDWALDGSDPWGMVDRFARDKPQLAEGLPGEIDEVLVNHPTEKQLQHLIHEELGCDYLPPAHDWTYGGWLSAIADRVSRPPADQRTQAKSHLVSLERLLRTYFHQDWVDDYPDPWDAVDDFIHEEPQLAAELPAEVKSILQETPTEAQLRQLVEELRFGYYIEADGWTYRGWLSAVADRVKQATAA